MRLSVVAALAACSLSSPACAQPAPTDGAAALSIPYVKREADAVLTELASTLDTDFVQPEFGHAYARMLRARLASGAYDKSADAVAFASAVTSDLRSVHKDAHLRLMAPKTGSEGKRQEATLTRDESTITGSGWIAPGVAYIGFSAFFGNDATIAGLNSFLEKVKGAKVLIIDARKHRGGGLDEMDVLFPQLFGKRTALVDLDIRTAVAEQQGDPFEDVKSMEKIDAPEGLLRRVHYAIPAAAPGLANAKVYLLTSSFTASAAEHLALSLKRTHRATLIGETTRGAGNFGRPASLGFGYSAFIPTGRTFDPDTGEGWEGVGVKPDIVVTADNALDEALKLAGVNQSGEAALAALK